MNPRRPSCVAELPGEAIDFNAYRTLHPDAHQLITGWLDHASQGVQGAGAPFEPFIFAWIALNGWAERVTGMEQDSGWRDALAASDRIRDDFKLLISVNKGFARSAEGFWSLMPIFKASDLRRHQPCLSSDRPSVVRYWLAYPDVQRAPWCVDHHGGPENVPLDWPHTLHALYRVRCNLFHGEKSRTSESDRQIVRAAVRVLIGFLNATGYLSPRSFISQLDTEIS